MTMNSTGQISLAGTTAGESIEKELGGNGTTQISLNDSSVRTLGGKPTGAITMPTDFYGKSNRVSLSYTFSSNTANASLNLNSISGYVAGGSDITITINSGVYLYATSTANAALTLTGGTTGDTLTIVNNGYIMGQGGQGGGQINGGATAGGTALSISINATINNTNASAYIGGGGGGGGYAYTGYGVGGGGGGGAGGGVGGTNNASTAIGGSGGSIGSSGSNGTGNGTTNIGGGGGGRIFPSTSTTATVTGGVNSYSVGLGGSGGGTGCAANNAVTTTSSTGGGAGQNGSVVFNTSNSYIVGGGAGGWGASGSAAQGLTSTAGASGGKAVALNGKTVTWVSGNTTRVYGAIA